MGIFSSAISAVGKQDPIFGGLFAEDETPQFKMPEESAQLKDMRGHVFNQSNASEQDLINRQMAGLNPNAMSGLGQEQDLMRTSLGGGDPALSAAIGKKASHNFDSAFNNTKQKIALDARNYRFDRLSQAIAPFQAENEAQRNAAQQQAAAQSAAYAARANAIKGVLGTVGAAVGGVFGGMYGGAAGAQAGSQFGSQAGGSNVSSYGARG
jgi:hypothetical protein